MKIRSKLSLGLMVLVSLTGLMAYLSFSQSQSLLKGFIVSDAFFQGKKAFEQIHQGMAFQLQELASSHFVLTNVMASNAEFQKLPQVDSYIEQIDRDWIAKKNTPFIDSILTNRLSQFFQEQQAFYKKMYAYPIFGEIFLTNKYGVVIAASGRTTDYKQSDEFWYQQAWKSSSYWMGNPEYDQSSDMIAIDSVIPLRNSNGETIGVLKGTLNIEYVKNIVKQIQSEFPHQSVQTYLVDKEGFLLFSEIDPELKQGGDIALKDFGKKLDFYQDVLNHIGSREGSFLDKERGELFVLAHSSDFNWSLLVSFKTKELFASVKVLRENLIGIFSVVLVLAVFLAVWLSHSFSNPLKQLEEAVALFGQGKLETSVTINSKDEIGQLALMFNKMAVDLNLLKRDLEKRVAERTEEIVRREKFTRSIIETANDAFVSMNEQGLITDWNKRAEEIFGWPREQVIGQKLIETTIPLKYQEIFLKGLQPLLKKEKKEVFYQRVEITALHRDGHEFPVELTLWPIWEENSCYFSCFIRDISEKKELQKQFVQAQKMEGIGRLAGGVAHDFNNQLTAIIGFSQILLDSLGEKGPHQQEVQEILNAANRSAKLTHQLLTFSRREMIHPKRMNLNEVVIHLDRMLRRLVSENIEFSVIPEEDLWTVEMDPSQVEHILMNLVVNAKDAMPKGGKVIIETKNIYLDEAYTRRHPDFLSGDYVLLAVSDTGIGMSKEVQAHLFEPFFTTKEKGKGTGLGLATCYGIIRQNKGNVLVYSELGVGTTFKIYFPRVKEEAQSVSELKKEKQEVVLHGDETILVVEDEVSVRKMVVQVLKSQGYHILEASNGEEALRVAQNHAEGIDLLFSDVVMPQMGGLELFEEIRKVRQGIKVLFTSGYTDEAILETGKLKRGVDFIHKPFSTAAVSLKVREILNAEKKEAA